jgi:hypothetical protein
MRLLRIFKSGESEERRVENREWRVVSAYRIDPDWCKWNFDNKMTQTRANPTSTVIARRSKTDEAISHNFLGISNFGRLKSILRYLFRSESAFSTYKIFEKGFSQQYEIGSIRGRLLRPLRALVMTLYGKTALRNWSVIKISEYRGIAIALPHQ